MATNETSWEDWLIELERQREAATPMGDASGAEESGLPHELF